MGSLKVLSHPPSSRLPLQGTKIIPYPEFEALEPVVEKCDMKQQGEFYPTRGCCDVLVTSGLCHDYVIFKRVSLDILIDSLFSKNWRQVGAGYQADRGCTYSSVRIDT